MTTHKTERPRFNCKFVRSYIFMFFNKIFIDSCILIHDSNNIVFALPFTIRKLR